MLFATFYRLPATSTVEGWHRQAPDGFVDAANIGQYGLHRKKLLDSEQWLPRHVERIDNLGTARGPHRLASWARRIDQWLADDVSCWAYFNNDVWAESVADAAWLVVRTG